MTIAEKIKQLQARLQQAEAARNSLVAKSVEEDRSLTDDEVKQYNDFSEELDKGAKELVRLQTVEKSLASQAVAVPRQETDIKVTDKSAVSVTTNAPKGSAFTRTAMVLAKSNGNLAVAKMLAEEHYKDDAVVNGIIKSAVSAGSTQVAEWAGNLIYPETYAGDFIELLYPQTILGRLNLRKVPFNVRIAGQNGGTTVGWVGEAKPVPVTSAKFNAIFLTWAKVYAIAAFSDELIRFSNPAAEALVQADLLKATAQGLDHTFISNGAAVANVSPAGMLNGVSGVKASGSEAPHLIADIQTLTAPAIAANLDLSRAVLVMSPARAQAIGAMRNALGAKYFPDISKAGGTLENYPVITSNNCPGDQIVFLIPDEVYLSEDAGPQIDITREASIIMDSVPENATSAPVSMFQNNMVAVRIGQFINWQKRRNLAANVITGATYGSTTSA
ncbi:phage major capsid protein [Burkholderia pseudomallei]|uniref:phage major capsid protein n=1 Tax=Burkholderia pseudomallei TaxID=28450 RepID=UPI00016ABD3C|nr:phage major capsid protein [Burkholderia pseudomallei]KGC37661.1 phage major capsid protein, HK97 family [Burkholderia pseudomallei]MBF4069578.1 phage major capsid protein [Burkholderia pseudomallei]MBF4126871.1 phage major capsid protein [Burkholderia pseudomallei]MXP94625.1 phage major capsid protein [Burkholderia pseudomallei]MXQ33028.1 phage major capsid protein [Burkholderia pseudomallei]